MDISSSLAANDVLALAELSSAIHIWRIDRATRPEPFPRAYPITQDAEMDLSPNISANGAWLAFTKGLSNDRQIQVINTRTGEKKHFPTVGTDKRSPLVDDSGRTLAYEGREGDVRSVYLVRQDSNMPTQVCSGCQSPTGWIKGSEGLLLSDAATSQIDIYWLATGELQTILAKPGAHVAQATWSPANQFILFTVTLDQGKDQTKEQAFVTRFPWGTKQPDSNWIAVTGPSASVQVPRWSGDGKTIYYLSDRDHSCCLWAQHFDPRAGRPVGQPFSVQHFSGRKFSPYVISSGHLNLSVAANAVYLNIANLRGSIWVGQVERLTKPLSSDFFRWQ
jgi:WD40 repeat protein